MSAATQLNPSILTNEQLQVIAFALVPEIKKALVPESLLTKAEAAEYLRIEYRTLEKRLQKKVYPARLIHRVDGSIYFLASELLEFVKTC
jgi:hypothetical protein